MGRILSIDPVGAIVGDPRTTNRYAYAANNPYKYVDPTGELFFLAPVAIFLVKEVAAEVASHYTNGATDWLSAKVLAKKSVGIRREEVSQEQGC